MRPGERVGESLLSLLAGGVPAADELPVASVQSGTSTLYDHEPCRLPHVTLRPRSSNQTGQMHRLKTDPRLTFRSFTSR